jgi:hypothetical protein
MYHYLGDQVFRIDEEEVAMAHIAAPLLVFALQNLVRRMRYMVLLIPSTYGAVGDELRSHMNPSAHCYSRFLACFSDFILRHAKMHYAYIKITIIIIIRSSSSRRRRRRRRRRRSGLGHCQC